MGGLGTLKIGFTQPGRFQAIAANEAGIDPGLTCDQSSLRLCLCAPRRRHQRYNHERPARTWRRCSTVCSHLLLTAYCLLLTAYCLRDDADAVKAEGWPNQCLPLHAALQVI